MFQTKMILLHRYAIHFNDLIVKLNMELIILNLSVTTLDGPTAILFIVIFSTAALTINFRCQYSASIEKYYLVLLS